jgi:TetR/AcrR family transcriptional regulator, transcriptional repressor of bet genes
MEASVPGVRAPEAERRQQIVDAGLRVAARDRLEGLTVRRVAAEAGLSPGLVYFHLTDKETLLLAVLDRLIERLVPRPDLGSPLSARDLLIDHVRSEVAHLPEDRELVELFLDFWVMGTRHPAVRGRIADALVAYRRALVPLAEDVIAEEPVRFAGTTAERLAAMVVAFVHGHAVQAVLDPEAIASGDFVATLEALVPGPVGSAGPPG